MTTCKQGMSVDGTIGHTLSPTVQYRCVRFSHFKPLSNVCLICQIYTTDNVTKVKNTHLNVCTGSTYTVLSTKDMFSADGHFRLVLLYKSTNHYTIWTIIIWTKTSLFQEHSQYNKIITWKRASLKCVLFQFYTMYNLHL